MYDSVCQVKQEHGSTRAVIGVEECNTSPTYVGSLANFIAANQVPVNSELLYYERCSDFRAVNEPGTLKVLVQTVVVVAVKM
jgi:hypothetical protein